MPYFCAIPPSVSQVCITYCSAFFLGVGRVRCVSGVGVLTGWSVGTVVGNNMVKGARVGVGSRVTVSVGGKGELV